MGGMQMIIGFLTSLSYLIAMFYSISDLSALSSGFANFSARSDLPPGYRLGSRNCWSVGRHLAPSYLLHHRQLHYRRTNAVGSRPRRRDAVQ